MPTLPLHPECHPQTPIIALGSSWGHLVLMSTQGGSTCTWCHSPGASAAPRLPPSSKSPHKLRMLDGAAMPLVDATVFTLQPASGSRCSCRDTRVLATATSHCSRSRTLEHPRRSVAPHCHISLQPSQTLDRPHRRSWPPPSCKSLQAPCTATRFLGMGTKLSAAIAH